MFTTIFLIALVIGLIPLILLIKKIIDISNYNDRYYRKEEKKQYPSNLAYIIAIGIPILLGLVWIFFSLYANYATDYFWYQELGRTDVFWTLLIPKLKIFFTSFVVLMIVFSTFMLLQYRSIFGEKYSTLIPIPIAFVVALLGGLSIASEWQAILMYQNQALSGILDPLFQKDASYYLFTLPLYDDMFLIAKSFLFVALIFALVLFIVKAVREEMSFEEVVKNIPRAIWIIMALWCSVHVFDRQLSIYQLMYSDHGLFAGVNYVGQNVDIPIYHTEQIVFGVLGLILLCIPFFKKAQGLFKFLSIATIIVMFGGLVTPLLIAKFNIIWFVVVLIFVVILITYLFIWGKKMHRELLVLINILITIIIVQFFVNEFIVPNSVQTVFVSPKEKQIEAPYIKNNIKFTRQAFCLTNEYLVEKSIPYSENLTKESLLKNKQTIDNIRILDQPATIEILDNSQTETQYYHFNDIDVDRYPNPDGTSTMFFVGAREINQSGLQSQTYYNTKYVYGHGYGYIKARGNTYDITSGYPILDIKGMPIKNGEPRIYYQEGVVPDFFYVNSNQKEIDYPVEKGEVEYNYTGKGGIPINTMEKKICFAQKYDWRLLFGGAPVNSSTRLMINRNIIDRVTLLCPFISWSSDALFVIRPNGRTAWIVNGYSITNHFPYASTYKANDWDAGSGSFNYIRHSVKAVVDAFDGTVDFYIVNEKNDPIISTIKNIFPNMFKLLAQMPKDLQQHLIYPEFYFKAQAYMYLKYHMNDPYEFYQQDKIWRVANENYKGAKTRMEPRYMLLRLPNEEKEKFVITIPFTPKELNENQTRDYLTGWVAGECDAQNFLKFNVYMYPKGKEIFGPWMIENATNTESQISKSFTLWGSGGSNVWQGNLMLVPIDNTVISVEPIIVLAKTDGGKEQLPSVKMIVVSQNKHLAWGRTTEEALYNLLQGNKPQEAESFTGPAISVYNEWEVTVPVVDTYGKTSSKTISVSSPEEAIKEIQKSILKFEEGITILKGTITTLQTKK
ncbi:MAG: UPF0182 family protein [bacterium]